MYNSIGSLIISVSGLKLTDEEREMIAHPLVGGVILFARNYEAKAQLRALIQSIRGCKPTPLLLMVDQEGGRVQRFKNEFTALPSLATFGQQYSKDPENACAMAQLGGWLMAYELINNGIDLSLAPVLDLNTKKSTVIGDRGFHADPEVVIRLAHAYISGMQYAGMQATGKHFPGHGQVQGDSHYIIPQDDRNLQEILTEDLVPFLKLKNRLSAMMAAHIIFPNIDKFPVSYSMIWLKKILREQLNYNGVIISDDLNMQGAAISSDYSDRFKLAKSAGCDLVLICNHPAGIIQVLDRCPSDDKQFYISDQKRNTVAGTFSGWNDSQLSYQEKVIEFKRYLDQA